MGMINLSQETEALAQRLAAAQRLSVEATIQRALEAHARLAGIEQEVGPRRRMTVEQMLAVGSEIAAMPILDPRSPNEIMDDLNAP
jgi:antitoxin VapB